MPEPATKEDVRQIMREELRPAWKRIERHEREIYGHNGTPGLTTREQENTTHRHKVQKYFYATWGTMVTFMGGLIYKLFGGH